MSNHITPWTVAAIGSEDAEQQALIMWVNMASFAGIDAANDEKSYYSKPTINKPIKELSLLFAIPNGGLRNHVTANRLKATGVKKGVPDLFLPLARSYHGLFIEMKKKGGIVSKEQKEWQKELTKQNYRAIICRGWVEARNETIKYLGV
jgi:hypothetical protein